MKVTDKNSIGNTSFLKDVVETSRGIKVTLSQFHFIVKETRKSTRKKEEKVVIHFLL